MDKLEMQSKNLVDDNIGKIEKLFPNCVTEAKDENGKLVKMVDFDLLKQELSKEVVEGNDERYTLNWAGKKQAILTANSPINATLRPCREESVDFDNTKNLYIEGDNLDVLKLLRETYFGKVKMIYIDPPYNTGNDFVYEDDFATSVEDYLQASKSYDEQGNRMFQNSDSNGRFHSDWLSMMYSRLKLAKDFLSDDGTIFISIGSNEVTNLQKLCDELYGSSNLIGLVTRLMKSGGGKGQYFSPNIEYLLIYAKNKSKVNYFREPLSEEIINKLYTSIESEGPRKGERYRPFGLYQSSLDPMRGCSNQRYFIEAPDGSLLLPPGNSIPKIKKDGEQISPKNSDDKVWRWSRDRYLEEKRLGNIVFKKSDGVLIDSNGNPAKWNIYTKIWLNDRQEEGMVPVDLITKWENRHSAKELQELDIPFTFAKPVELIKYLIKLPSYENDITILDFFSGSATTAHAVMQLNAEDGGNRKFIMVQLPEKCDEKSEAYKAGYKNICEIGKERIRRAGLQILLDFAKEHIDDANDEQKELLKRIFNSDNELDYIYKNDIQKDVYEICQGFVDVGFRDLKLDSSCMKDVYYDPASVKQDMLSQFEDNIKEDRTPEDLLLQVMLDMGALLSTKIIKKTISSKEIFIVDNNPDLDEPNLICCFDKNLSDEVVTEIAKLKPRYAVFRDASMSTDSVAVNFDQIFETYSPTTTRKII